jgi:hypothetical protein
MFSKKTNTIVLISLIFSVCSVCALVWVLYTVTRAEQSLRERIAIIADTRAKERAYKDLALQVENTKAQRTTLGSFVLTEEGTGAFLTEIERLGVLQGVTLTTNTLKVVTKKDLPDTLQVQFAIVGGEQAVRKMLTILETLPYHSVVSSLTLTKETGGQVRSVVDLAVTLFKHD